MTDPSGMSWLPKVLRVLAFVLQALAQALER